MKTSTKNILLGLTGAFFAGAGAMHFIAPEPYAKIIPPWIPKPREMVAISGVSEIAGGLGLLLPQTRRPAAWGLAAMLMAIFPANIYMATEHPTALLWLRLPLQPLMIWWVLKISSPHVGQALPPVAVIK